MKKTTILLLIVMNGLIAPIYSQTNDTCYFRIMSEANSVITHFNPSAGILMWSSSVAGAKSHVQRTSSLTSPINWEDYMHTVSYSMTTTIDTTLPQGMVMIPAGTNSGTNPLGEGESYLSFYPEHYSLNNSASFYMDATEVTKAKWDEVYSWAITNGYDFGHTGSGKATNHPVHTVNWYDCVKWCNARSEMEQRPPCYTVSNITYKAGDFGVAGSDIVDCDFYAKGYRLPTSEEWEYAARGGLQSKRYSWGDTVAHSDANYLSTTFYSYDISPTKDHHPQYDDGNEPYTSPAGSFAPNGYGLYDTAGSVWEWCWDPSGIIRRTLRSGGWNTRADLIRCAIEGKENPLLGFNYIGFRCVCR